MTNQYAHLVSGAIFEKMVGFAKLNSSLLLAKCRVMAVGKNRNYSYFDKARVEDRLWQLDYLPVVGNVHEKTDEDGNTVGHYFGGHEYFFDENGEYVTNSVPFGVVVPGTYQWETVNEYGADVEYLSATVALWTERYPVLEEAAYSDEVMFGQSMEVDHVTARPLAEDSNYSEVLDWRYSALCLLGKSDDDRYDTEPCFISADVEKINFSADEARNNFEKAMEELRQQVSLCLEQEKEKGGKSELLTDERMNEIFADAGLSRDEIDFEMNADMTEELLLAAIDEFKKKKCCEDGDGQEGDPEPEKDAYELFAATANEKREAISSALPEVCERDANGCVTRSVYFWLRDYDDTYAYVERTTWMPDNCECENGRLAYVFDDSARTATITGEFTKMVCKWLTLEECAAIEEARTTAETELTELRAFKTGIEQAQRQSEVDAMFDEFADISAVDGFEALRADAMGADDLEAIRDKLFALRGRNVKVQFEAQGTPVVRVGIEHNTENEDAYGGLLVNARNANK